MKNFNSFFNQLTAMPKRLAMVLTVLFTLGVGSMWGAEYETPFTITSDAVVSGSGYTKYTYTDASSRGWIITHGGNNKSVGTNSNNRNSCKLTNYSKYAVSPVTTSSIASAFVSTTSLTDIGKISYTFNGGKNQTSTQVYLIYSSDNNTFSQISLSTGTQGATISSGTSYTFAKKTGCFGFCEKGPIVKVLPEDSFYVEVKPEDAKDIIAENAAISFFLLSSVCFLILASESAIASILSCSIFVTSISDILFARSLIAPLTELIAAT